MIAALRFTAVIGIDSEGVGLPTAADDGVNRWCEG
jgi:hypothetical protein